MTLRVSQVTFVGMTVLRATLDARWVRRSALARHLGVAKSALCEWEAGKRPVPSHVRPRLAEALGTDEGQLFDEQGVARHG